jgi:hypothetical protein
VCRASRPDSQSGCTRMSCQEVRGASCREIPDSVASETHPPCSNRDSRRLSLLRSLLSLGLDRQGDSAIKPVKMEEKGRPPASININEWAKKQQR